MTNSTSKMSRRLCENDLLGFPRRDGGEYEVNPVGKSNISPWNYRKGDEGKRCPENTSSHAELEFYLPVVATQLRVI
jgi:hypothetical protein